MQRHGHAQGKDREWLPVCRMGVLDGTRTREQSRRRETANARCEGEGPAGSVTWKSKKAPNDHNATAGNLTAL